MPDILIRMEMPERCDAKCPLYNTGRGYFDCVVTKQYYNWGLPGRPSDCPLVELPEHGDLIDRDAILNAEKTKPIAKMMMFGGAYVIDLDVVRDAPVVIQAEKGETQ